MLGILIRNHSHTSKIHIILLLLHALVELLVVMPTTLAVEKMVLLQTLSHQVIHSH